MAMRMRQSLAQLEQAFHHEAQQDRQRRDHLRRTTARRTRKRRHEREKARSNVRFVKLVFSLIATAVIVTVAMFETLNLLLA